MSNPALARKARWAAFAIFVVLAIVFWPRILQGLAGFTADDAPDFPRGHLVFQRADGTKIPFDIEIATTARQQAYGLMFRHALPADAGMIFLQDSDHEAVFWMENTLIPLDMLFVKSDGTIAKIVVNAKPLDLSSIHSDQPVRAVVEINGGEAARRGLKEGDKVIFPGLGGS